LQLLRFLEGLASCEGEQIIENQERLLQLYFSRGKLEGRKESWKRHRLQLAVETVLLGDADRRGGALGGAGCVQDFDGSDVLISWHGGPNWQPGDEYFYYNLAGLGLAFTTCSMEHGCLHNYLSTTLAEEEERCERKRRAKEWVRLESLTVLQDTHPYSLQVVDLLTYYEAQIDMYAEMIVGRSYNCIYAFEAQFSFVLCFTVIKYSLFPDSLRSSYCKLMTRLYVDRYPHTPIVVPRRVQDLSATREIKVTQHGSKSVRKSILDTIRRPELTGKKKFAMQYTEGGNGGFEGGNGGFEGGNGFDALPQFQLPDGHLSMAKAATNPFYACQNADKFKAAQDLVAEWFKACGGEQVIPDKQHNGLTLSLLECVLKMMHMGFYGKVQSIRLLCCPLIVTLDGRSDRYFADGNDRESQSSSGKDDTRRPSIALDAGEVVENPMMHGGSTVPTRSSSPVQGSSAELSMRNTGVGSSIRVGQYAPADLSVGNDERYHVNASTLMVMQSKKCICNILSFVSDLRLDFRINRILYLFRNIAGKKLTTTLPPLMLSGITSRSNAFLSGVASTFGAGDFGALGPNGKAEVKVRLTAFASDEIQRLFKDSESEVLDLDSMGASPLVPVLLDLMMYRSSSLFEAAFSLLHRHFNQLKALVTTCSGVQLVVSKREQEELRVLENKVSDLRENVESFEIWGVSNEFSTRDTGVYQHVQVRGTRGYISMFR
jgi:hypothetical protein